MPGTSKSAWNNWRNLAIRSVRGTLSPRASTVRPQSSLIKTFGSAAMAFVAAVADADAISSDMIARKIRRDISAELPFSFCRQLPFGAMQRSGPPTLGGDVNRRSILSQIGTAGTQEQRELTFTRFSAVSMSGLRLRTTWLKGNHFAASKKVT